MRKMIYTIGTAAAAAAMVIGGTASAYANGNSEDDGTKVAVFGTQLHVKLIRAKIDGHDYQDGSRARVWAMKPGWKKFHPITDWRYADEKQAGDYKYSQVQWKPGKSYPNKTKLCTKFEGHKGFPCVVIHK